MNPVESLRLYWEAFHTAQTTEAAKLQRDLREDEAHECLIRAKLARLVLKQMDDLAEQLQLHAEPAPVKRLKKPAAVITPARAHERAIADMEAKLPALAGAEAMRARKTLIHLLRQKDRRTMDEVARIQQMESELEDWTRRQHESATA